MAKNITLRNNTSVNTGKGAQMTHAEMDANLETFFMSSSLDGTTLYLYSTGSANVDSIDLSGLGGAGAQGIQGIQGTDGSQGLQGTDGSQGTQGLQGIQGNGTQGTQGVQGIAGGAASQGIQGTQGIQGIQGESIQGIQGIAGGASSQGIQGTQGIQGIQGIEGIQGLTGTGIQGVQGTQGEAGITSGRIYYFNNSQTEIGFFRLGDTPTSTGQTTEALNTVANTANQVIATYITPELGFTVIPHGVQRFHLHFTKDSQNDDIEVSVRLIHTDLNGNIIQTIGISQVKNVGWNNNSQTPVEVELDIVLPTATIASTDRMKVEIYVNNNENQNIPVTLYSEGNTYYSYVTTTVGASQGQDGAQGTQGIQGTKGAQGIQGTKGAQGIQGTDGIAEADFYDQNTRSTQGFGFPVTGSVVAGTSMINNATNSTVIQIKEIGSLKFGEQVHITATPIGTQGTPYIIRVDDANLPYNGGANALSALGEIRFSVPAAVDVTLYFMYHVWYTTDSAPS